MFSFSCNGLGRSWGRVARRVRVCGRDEKGATAIEFAMVAGPFFAMLFGIISVGFYYFTLFTLENAIETASRRIRTGQAQTAKNAAGVATPDNINNIRAMVCSSLPPYMKSGADCGPNIRVHVQNYSGYGAVVIPSCLQSGGLIPTDSQVYSTGTGSAVVLASVCFEWEMTKAFKDMLWWWNPSVNEKSTAMTNGSTLIQAATMFTVEPYN